MLKIKNTKTMFLVVGVLVLLSNETYGQANKNIAKKQIDKHLQTLKSDAAIYEKAMACRQLAIVGDKTAVPTLGSFLNDSKLATYARTALEAIPGDAADEELRKALKKTKGDLLVGVINSLGKRRCEKAIPDVTKLLVETTEKRIILATARALGNIGTSGSAKKLLLAFKHIDNSLHHELANACLINARNIEGSDKKLALELYSWVKNNNYKKHLTLAATQRLIVIRGDQHLPLLTKLLGSKDTQSFRFGIQAAKELQGKSNAILIQNYNSTKTTTHKAIILNALGEIGNKTSLPLIRKAANHMNKDVRLQAILALSRFNDPEATAIFFNASTDEDKAIAQVGQSALASLSGDEIEETVLNLLNSKDLKILQVAIKLSGQRGLVKAAPSLLKLTKHADLKVQNLAIAALGSTINNKNLPLLVRIAVSTKDVDQQKLAQKALAVACGRLPQEQTATQIVNLMESKPIEAKVMLLELLTTIGGKTALKAVVTAAKDNNDTLQDAATRLLGTWMTADVAPELLQLTKSFKKGKYKTRVLRGYIRAARQLEMTDSQRLEICRTAMTFCDRNEEKTLILTTLGRNNSPQAMSLAAKSLKEKAVQVHAIRAILSIAKKIVSTAPREVESQMRVVLETTKNQVLVARAKELQAQARERIQFIKSTTIEKGFVSIFNGKSLEGWEGNLKMFQVKDGAILGGSLKDRIPRNEFLCTKKEYGDFELRLQFKIIGKGANAGVQFRSRRIPNHHEVSGYQADLGDNWWGCIYDESRRNKVLTGPDPKKRAEPIRREKWNEYRIRAKGNRIQLWINGTKTADYTEKDLKIPVKGIIGLQVHSGGPMQAWYRNIRIKELKGKD